MKMNSNEIKIIKDNLFLSKIIKNLNSIDYIIKNNLNLEFLSERCFIKIFKNYRLIAHASQDKHSGMYRLNSEILLSKVSYELHTCSYKRNIMEV